MTNGPFHPSSTGRLTLDRFDFNKHLDGSDLRQAALTIDTFPGINGTTNVQDSLNEVAIFIAAIGSGGATMLVLDVSAGGTITLTADQASHQRIKLIGAPSTNTTVIVPPGSSQGWIKSIWNSITGFSTITIKNNVLDTGQIIAQSDIALLFSDNSNVKLFSTVLTDGSGFSTDLISGVLSNNITITLPNITTTVIGRDTTDTISNKTIDAAVNSISNLTNTSISASANIAVSKLAPGTAGQFLQTSGGVAVWGAGGGGGGGSPGGSDTQLQYNNANSFGGISGVVSDGTTIIFTSDPQWNKSSNIGTLVWTPTTAQTLTLPDATDTIVATNTTDTITNKTINATNNTITDTGTTAGDILRSDGTKFTKFGIGSSLQILQTNSGGTDIQWGSIPGNIDCLILNNNVSTTSLTAVNTNFTFAIGANETWFFDCNLMCQGNGNQIKFAVAAPSGATTKTGIISNNSSGGTTVSAFSITAINTLSSGISLSLNSFPYFMRGVVKNSSTAGNVTIQFASSSNIINATINSLSYMIVTQATQLV